MSLNKPIKSSSSPIIPRNAFLRNEYLDIAISKKRRRRKYSPQFQEKHQCKTKTCKAEKASRNIVGLCNIIQHVKSVELTRPSGKIEWISLKTYTKPRLKLLKPDHRPALIKVIFSNKSTVNLLHMSLYCPMPLFWVLKYSIVQEQDNEV